MGNRTINFKVNLKNADVKMLRCSDNINIKTDSSKEFTSVTFDDTDVEVFEWWAILQATKTNYYIDTAKEVRSWADVPPDEQALKFYFIQKGMLYVEGYMTSENWGSRTEIDLTYKTKPTTTYKYKVFDTNLSENILHDIRFGGVNEVETTINFRAVMGYKINTLKIEDYSTKSIQLSEDSKTATSTFTPMYDLWLSGTSVDDTQPEIILIPVNKNLTNITTDIVDEVEQGKEITINFNTIEPYYMNNNTIQVKYYVDLGNGTGILKTEYATVNTDDNTKASITITPYSSITITGTGIEYLPYKKIPVTANLQNCTAKYNDIDLIDGQEIEIPKTELTGRVVFYANDGYVFKSGGYWQSLVTTNVDVISDDRKTLSKSVRVDGDKIKIGANAVQDVLPEKIGGGFTNIYLVDDIILNQLSKKRFYKVDTSGGGSADIDFGQFITRLYVLPFDIEQDIISEEPSHILLGTNDTGIQAHHILNNMITLNLGTISIPEKYYNVYDYVNTRCYLNVPYSDKIELDTSYIINNDISLEYIIDLFTGDGTLNVISTFNNNLIHTEVVKLGYDIPFIQKQSGSVISEYTTPIQNKITNSFIEVVRNIPYNVDTKFGKPSIDYGTLIDYTGYIEVDNIELNTVATNNEKNQIINLLQNGVIIK